MFILHNDFRRIPLYLALSGRIGYYPDIPPVAVIMIGAIPLVPIMNLIFRPVVTPLYTFFGASPAMFAGTLLPLDLGAGLPADLYYRRFMAKPDAARIS